MDIGQLSFSFFLISVEHGERGNFDAELYQQFWWSFSMNHCLYLYDAPASYWQILAQINPIHRDGVFPARFLSCRSLIDYLTSWLQSMINKQVCYFLKCDVILLIRFSEIVVKLIHVFGWQNCLPAYERFNIRQITYFHNNWAYIHYRIMLSF